MVASAPRARCSASNSLSGASVKTSPFSAQNVSENGSPPAALPLSAAARRAANNNAPAVPSGSGSVA